MPKLLHLIASPRAESHSLRLGRAFLDAYRRIHPDVAVDVLHLFDDEIPEFRAPEAKAKYAVLAGGKPTGQAHEAWKAVIEVVDHLKAADVVLISSAMWNFSIPYRLKQYIDVIVQPGLTFNYSPDEGYTGLLTGKKAVLALARGGDYGPGGPENMDYQESYLRAILNFIGITDIHSVIVQPTLMGGPDVAEAKVQEALRQAEALARRL